MDYEVKFHETPFEPAKGLHVKHGRLFSDKRREIDVLEQFLQFRFPRDFLDLIGDYCSVGFDGDYVIKSLNRELTLLTIVTIACPDERNVFGDSIPEVLERHRGVFFGSSAVPRFIPFAEAYLCSQDGNDWGWLAFERSTFRQVFYVPGRTFVSPFQPGKTVRGTLAIEPFNVAPSVAAMMSHAVFRHYG